ncbi:M1 family aminopeptidase [Aquimarina sp. AU474]|uniref:ABC transporter permease/M1 family aminopeptidase n=1 Tax=Aquimarina sp. AU474 TaxID=2108529 RepID=UPI000D69B17E|nr:M1 family aminopeptidase [Aquimarina sp. AU474]
MWYEIFKFELKYRVNRPETYVFFGFLFLFSIIGIDFIFQGVELGLMKKNAPLVIAKTMAAITGIFMIMTSMIMGVPILRDFQYDTEALLFINPITKFDYLLGRFLGSFITLLFIFSGLLFGMMLGSQMPWHKEQEMLAFSAFTYIQSFTVVVVPTLFFGACVFFVSGMLSKKLLVVYTQGIVLFVMFLLTKAITNEYVQGIFDPFSLTTLTQVAKDWSVGERNTLGISLNGILLHNKLFWVVLGVIVLLFGYRKFSFSTLAKKSKRRWNKKTNVIENSSNKNYPIPKALLHHNFKAQCLQLFKLSKFYSLSLLKETSFWAIIICGIIIIVINSVNLGTVYGVDSYPATHFIIAELQEMSMYFFIIILLFYSGELIWKERAIKQYVLNDTTSINNIITLTGKFLALINIYIVLMLSLIVTGILFQVASGYYRFDLDVYFSGFFVEILPYLILYTFIAFFFQVISKNKFIGIFLVLVFFIINISSEFFGFQHSLYKFGGKTLGTYSEMNGYGHFLKPYLWIKAYWLIFGIILLITSALIMVRGTETSLWKRVKTIKNQITNPILYFGISSITIFLVIGIYIFYNTNILNTYWTNSQEQNFRVNYEKTLKPLEYIPQPQITNVSLAVELYPKTRSYEIKGMYTLKNTTNEQISEIHIQKLIASHVILKDVIFEGGATANTQYNEFDYTIYNLSKPLQPKSSIQMNFKQSFSPKGFEDDNSSTQIVHNGTFFNNSILPSIGYNSKYELDHEDDRITNGLKPRPHKAKIDDGRELINSRSGGDSDGINLEITIGTSKNQTAIVPGKLQKQWMKNNRNYFHYKMDQPIINFYSIVSANYEIKKDNWISNDTLTKPVDLEIYYHKDHIYNLDRMMAGMKASLTYLSTNFSPYQYQQLRIMEFPRYAEFAQSFPSTIPFSEAMGFVLNINNTSDVDMPFYITAHEVAHQWFGMQVEAANVQGRNFILETLAQYSAIMVLKENYPEEKVQQFLELQKEIYDTKRKKAAVEPSLALVENQDFVYYNKGAIAMYNLQQLIGEDKVNLALQRFIKDWRSYRGKLKMETNRYATSKDLLKYFRAVAPRDLHQAIHDLFETIKEI